VYPDGAHYYLGDDMAANVEETARFSRADARAIPTFERDLASLVQGVIPSFNWTAPDPRIGSLADLRELARWARVGLKQRKHLADLAFLFSTSATQFLSERFESEHVKAALGWHAINDSLAGPSTPGTGSGGSSAVGWAGSPKRWLRPRETRVARSGATPRSSACSRTAAKRSACSS
jgi:phytoene dehydrogenase-like protein